MKRGYGHFFQRMTTRFMPLVIAILLLCGCDGINVYQFHGEIVQNQTGAPVSSAPIIIAFNPDIHFIHFDSSPNASATRMDGTFSAGFTKSTGWVFFLRPPPPILNGPVYLFYKTSITTDSVRVDLTPAMQSECPNAYTRIVNLPPITIP